MTGIVFGSLFMVSAVVAGIVRLPYDSIGPGSTRVVNDLVVVRGHETFPPKGEILYATVSVRERVNGYEALVGWLDPDTDVVPEEDVRGTIPPDRYRQLNVEAMNDSKTTAEVLALTHLGFTDLGAGAEVDSVAPGSPAAAAGLEDKDVIVAIDDAPVSTAGDVVNAIRAHQPEDRIRLGVSRGEEPPLNLESTLTRAEDGRPLLGVRLSTKVELPFEITIDSGSVVGPSAGLAYALELLDTLTAGELTGGMKVAATGELLPNGEVGPIGGVEQKVVTVKRAGAKLFLVPKANEAEARARAGNGLQVRGVASFEEALSVLGTMQGSNARALGKPAPGT
ncbi:MAG: PDZ domain-containing protein [Actinobacteria bacterium]|nr:PDZ domain-containing protein [Actinomycetota bacterium]